MKKERNLLFLGIGLLAGFLIWTLLITQVDVRPVGPQNSSVGLASINVFFHSLTGVHLALYTITDWLSLVPAGMCIGFGILGLWQWFHRKGLRYVDRSLLILGGFYVVVLGAYTLFEIVEINYRPLLIEGILEASYPSSTTMLVMCVMPTAMLQLRSRIANPFVRMCLMTIIAAFTAFMVIGRLLSGVHWLTDILGGGLLSAGLVLVYASLTYKKDS